MSALSVVLLMKSPQRKLIKWKQKKRKKKTHEAELFPRSPQKKIEERNTHDTKQRDSLLFSVRTKNV